MCGCAPLFILYTVTHANDHLLRTHLHDHKRKLGRGIVDAYPPPKLSRSPPQKNLGTI